MPDGNGIPARKLDPLIARNRKLINDLSEAFWVIPGLMVLAGVIAAYVFVLLDHVSPQPDPLLEEAWLYRGGPAGARAVLGAIASSTIAVAGTVFSITIAALSLASGQMGPRLLRNFTRDRGNQITLGAFIGTFVYALMVLRTVRSPLEREFVPHLSLTVAILLAFVCVATLVWFVAHMAQRINVDTVIDLVSSDVHTGIDRMTVEGTSRRRPRPSSGATRRPSSIAAADIYSSSTWIILPTGSSSTTPQCDFWCGRATTCFPIRRSR